MTLSALLLSSSVIVPIPGPISRTVSDLVISAAPIISNRISLPIRKFWPYFFLKLKSKRLSMLFIYVGLVRLPIGGFLVVMLCERGSDFYSVVPCVEPESHTP